MAVVVTGRRFLVASLRFTIQHVREVCCDDSLLCDYVHRLPREVIHNGQAGA